MTELYTATVEVPMFISAEWDLFTVIRRGCQLVGAEPGDEAQAIFEGIRKDVDGWPLKIFTVKIIRGNDDKI